LAKTGPYRKIKVMASARYVTSSACIFVLLIQHRTNIRYIQPPKQCLVLSLHWPDLTLQTAWNVENVC